MNDRHLPPCPARRRLAGLRGVVHLAPMSKLSWTLLLTASMAGIAAFYPITKILDGAIDPFLLAFFRFSIAALVLLPFILYKGTLALPQKRDFPLFALVA